MTIFFNLIVFTITALPFTTQAKGPIQGGGGPNALALTKASNLKKEIPTSQLNLVLQNHLVKAEVERHPSQAIKLFDACINGDKVMSISNSPNTYCKKWAEQEVRTQNGRHKKLICQSWSAPRLKHSIRYAKNNPEECLILKGEEHPNQSLYGQHPEQLVPYCGYSRPAKNIVKTQYVRVYSMKEATSGPVYFSWIDEDKAHAGFSQYKYTLPNCNR